MNIPWVVIYLLLRWMGVESSNLRSQLPGQPFGVLESFTAIALVADRRSSTGHVEFLSLPYIERWNTSWPSENMTNTYFLLVKYDTYITQVQLLTFSKGKNGRELGGNNEFLKLCHRG